MIKLIEFEISGHPLFKDKTIFSIQATGKNNGTTSSRVINYNNALYLNQTIGVVGVNATGKSTLFDIFDGLSAFYLEDQSIDQTALQASLRGDQDIKVKVHIADTNGIRYLVETTFSQPTAMNWVVKDETIYKKQLGKSARKKDQFTFSDKYLVQERSKLSADVKAMLSDKDSAFRAYRGKTPISRVISMVDAVDTNRAMTFIDETPLKLLQYLDDSIESLDYSHDKTGKITNVQLKFKDRDEILNATTFEEITNYLSSGTVRGITLFYEMFNALRAGATLLVDEVELHINKRIVEDFIAFFQNQAINAAHATLIYSTHYLELIDDSERKDENYFLVRKTQKTQVYRYSDIPGLRGDVKKSDVFKANFIQGTAPNYERFEALESELTANITNRLREDAQ